MLMELNNSFKCRMGADNFSNVQFVDMSQGPSGPGPKPNDGGKEGDAN